MDDARLPAAGITVGLRWTGTVNGQPAALLTLRQTGGGVLVYAMHGSATSVRQDLRLLPAAGADTRPIDGQEYLSKLDIGVAHTARTWNYWLGGRDNFAADREIGEQILQFLPNMRITARADRAFLGRAVRYLAGEAGIRQFCGLGRLAG